MEFYVDGIEQMCELMCGSIEREENMISQDYATNVLMILRHKKESIGQFEKNHGFSTGYLSRVAKGTNRNLTLDAAWDIADDLNLDIEDILLTDWVETFDAEDRKKRIADLEAEQKRIASELQELRS